MMACQEGFRRGVSRRRPGRARPRGGVMRNETGRLSGALSGSGADLLFLDFRQGLAVDAQGGGGSGLQATQADFHAAGVAPAVFVLFDQGQGLVDLLDQLALAITV